MFKEIAQSYHQDFFEFHPFPKAIDREFWDTLPPKIRSSFNPHIKYTLETPYPVLPMSKFMDFRRNGNRSEYEALYFKRRRLLNTAILLECIYNDLRFMDTIINGIYLLCEESAWQLPSHNTYLRDIPTHLLPDTTRPILDLFACETGALLATIDYLIGEKLDQISPQIRLRIRQEIDHRIITPYLQTHFWWMGRFGEAMNNWTIWCTQNILLTFFLTPQPKHLRQAAFTKANTSIDYFLQEYGEDGCCDEGPLYYRHSGLCLFNTIELLNAITNNAYAHLYAKEKIKNMCAYLYNVHVHDQYYINFSDCSPVLEPSNVREFLFAKRTQHSSMMSLVACDYQKSIDPFMNDEINLFYRLQSIYYYDEISSYPTQHKNMPSDIYYESVGLWITRDQQFTLAVKSGDNDDSHNHNDTGSFTLYKNGFPIFIDIGVESYTAKTFSSDRYDIWTMQSDFHNLPTLNGKMQLPGSLYRATDISQQLGIDESFISMNLIHAYPELNSITDYYREVTFYKNKKIKIKDQLTCSNTLSSFDFISNLMTYIPPHIEGNDIFLNNLVHIHLDGDIHSIDVEVFPINDSRLQQAWKDRLYRLRIHVLSSTLTITIT